MMARFASFPVFKREGKLTFKAPRLEVSSAETQARKSASRFWNSTIAAPDQLIRVSVVSIEGDAVHVGERAFTDWRSPWVEHRLSPQAAKAQPPIAACLALLGYDASSAPPVMPDVLEVNGIIYRREI